MVSFPRAMLLGLILVQAGDRREERRPEQGTVLGKKKELSELLP